MTEEEGFKKKCQNEYTKIKNDTTGKYSMKSYIVIKCLMKYEDEDEIPVAGRTRAGKKKVQISDDLQSGVTDRSRQRESERFKREIEELNKQMPDLGDFENWNEEEELAKAGLTRIEEF